MNSSLPDELWQEIFQLTNEPRVYRNLLLTCRRFQAIAEPLLYRNVDLSAEGFRSRLFLNTVSSNPRLASYIEALATPDLPVAELRDAPFRNLRKIAYLYPSRPLFTSPDSLNEASAFLAHLTHLVSFRPIGNVSQFHQFLGGLPNLEYLSVPFTHDRNDPASCPSEILPRLNFLLAHAKQVIAILPGRTVQHLETTHAFNHSLLQGLSFPSIMTLATTSSELSCLPSFPNLKYLKVDHASASHPSLERALEIFRPLTCPSVQYLSVRLKFNVKRLKISKFIHKDAYRPRTSIVAHGAFRGFPALRVIDITLEWSPDDVAEIFRHTISENGLCDSDPMEMADDSEDHVPYWDKWWTSPRARSALVLCSPSSAS
ncbi:hypothetical protein ONZ45_g13820 [Pleurotus djamor]|nr:hypothetical protein ONZ45_g13820 [Pleurotus djamor]